MNSNSEWPLLNETSYYKQDQDCDCKHPVAKKVILKAKYSNFGPLDVTFRPGTATQTFNQPIASITIDTTCLDCENILIDFSGILNITNSSLLSSTLLFTLFRVCNGLRVRQPAAAFNFFVTNMTAGSTNTNSYTIVFKYPSENDDCRECCTYVLELTSISNLDLGSITYSINGTISALAIESSC